MKNTKNTSKKLKKLPEPKKLPELNKLEDISSKIIHLIVKAKKDLNALGMEEKSLDAMFNGKEVIDCPYCHTFNMCEIYFDKKREFTLYECYNCGKSYLTFDKDKKK